MIGYAYAVPFRKRPAYRYTVKHSIYVHHDHLRRGVGRQLMTALIDACAAAGFRQMIGYIDAANKASLGSTKASASARSAFSRRSASSSGTGRIRRWCSARWGSAARRRRRRQSRARQTKRISFPLVPRLPRLPDAGSRLCPNLTPSSKRSPTQCGARDRGEVASYIPELAHVDPAPSAWRSPTPRAGRGGGDGEKPFSIQSISKVFTLTLALGKVGDRLWTRVGRDPRAPRSIRSSSSSASAACRAILSSTPARSSSPTSSSPATSRARRSAKSCASCVFWPTIRTIKIDKAVADSEQRTGFRNFALAHYMKSFGVLDNPVDFTLGVYFHHCAIAMSCRQLAIAGRFLAHGGRNPATGLPWSSRSARGASTRSC